MAMDHSKCDHPRTPAGRAACRKAQGVRLGAENKDIKESLKEAGRARSRKRAKERTIDFSTVRTREQVAPSDDREMLRMEERLDEELKSYGRKRGIASYIVDIHQARVRDELKKPKYEFLEVPIGNPQGSISVTPAFARWVLTHRT